MCGAACLGGQGARGQHAHTCPPALPSVQVPVLATLLSGDTGAVLCQNSAALAFFGQAELYGSWGTLQTEADKQRGSLVVQRGGLPLLLLLLSVEHSEAEAREVVEGLLEDVLASGLTWSSVIQVRQGVMMHRAVGSR